ncbi:hypothetical protein SAMN05192583_0485 [Sphingomonas gellani]|uniref:Uncharacterized protein n=1 Tax=Sphingomonas gellani TaxID=1166340 RepID=A0A1H7Z0T9_9SPHN|nr:hypothetical protein [Sphingomonas gellani]SEM51791.1 hypothetical protein SAMN05192583_0485 [Sphingomonas gellani]
MFKFVRKRRERQRLIASLQEEAKRTRAHLASQALFAMEHLRQPAQAIWADRYSHGYIYGAYAQLIGESLTDDRLADEMIGSGFATFAANAFAIREEDARDALAMILARPNATPTRHAIADGRADGKQIQQGLPATLWLAHLAERAAATT